MSLDDPMGPQIASPIVALDICPCGFVALDLGRYLNCPSCRKNRMQRWEHHALVRVEEPIENNLDIRGPIPEALAAKPEPTDVEQRT